VLVALPAAPARAGTSPTGYAVTTAAAAVRVLSTQQPAFSIATGDLVDQTLGLASSSFGASTSEARAASYYPGDLLAQAGQLICGQFGPCPLEPPTYPLLAEASWPTATHATAGQGAGTAVATASPTGNSASTSAADGRASGGLLLGGATTTTQTRTGVDGLHVRVATTLHDISLGPLAIASIRVTDDVLVGPDGHRSASPHVVAGGVTVAGTPVELGSTPLPALAQSGLAVRVVGSDSSGARSGATGVRIDVSRPVRGAGAPAPGLPTLDRTYVGSFVLGQVAVVAARDDALGEPVLPLPSVPTTPTLGAQQPTTVQPPGTPGAETRPVPRAVLAAGPVSTVVLRLLGLDQVDLTDLYAVLALGSLGALVVFRRLTRRAWS